MSGGGRSSQDAGRCEEEESSPTPQEQEAMLKKKYGGLIPKKPPLISKDHERAYFDSADWALGKQGAPPNPLLGGSKPRSSMEALPPKLQPTPHQPLPARRSSYVPPDGEEGEPGTAPEAAKMEGIELVCGVRGGLEDVIKEHCVTHICKFYHWRRDKQSHYMHG